MLSNVADSSIVSRSTISLAFAASNSWSAICGNAVVVDICFSSVAMLITVPQPVPIEVFH